VALNADADHGATGGLGVLAYREGRPFEPTFMLHEMGHVMNLAHSFGEQPDPCASGDERPGAYCDVFDLMSAMNVRTFRDSQGRRCGPGLAAPNLQRLGWLHRSRVVSGWPARGHTVTLAALNRPDVDAPLALQLGGWPFRADYVYVEFRQATRWDRGIRGDVVLLHTVRGDGLTRLLTDSGRGGTLLAGDEIVLDGIVRVVVRVVSIDSAAGTATIRFWPLLQPGPREVQIVRVDFDPAGPEAQGESLTVRNDTATGVDLNGWRLEDVAMHVFQFPQRILEAGDELTVWTGQGIADDHNLYWGGVRPSGTTPATPPRCAAPMAPLPAGTPTVTAGPERPASICSA
jgi:Lamin Tail Domain